ncbi:MAG TPA: vWA domain-containing protein, partial [Polyangiaceae bacterium]|nr:vWA domain-containing protein [Polyangiaceae bacterium]
VSSALKSFLSDPASNGLGVGIQYFPLRDPSVPDLCTSDAQCGSHGPCFLKFCQGAAGYVPCSRDSECVTVDKEDVGPCTPLRFCAPLGANGDLVACHDDFECGARQTCELYNECAGDRSYVCTQPGQACRTQQGQDLGVCTGPESVCVHQSSCNAAQYAAPAAPIAALPGSLAALRASIDAQMPNGQTPTAPALKGAIQAATSWAQSHPDHSVVVLLATDGLPTECVTNPTTDAMGIAEVRQTASAGVAAAPSVLTFVIGVFGPSDTEARTNLDQIAMAGGTKTAFLVDTSADVSAQFQSALNEIRGSHLSCEYSVPAAPQGQSLDYNKVNVDFTNAGTTQRIAQVKDAAACGSADGWYYDTDPSVANPTRILICPSACERLQNSTMGSVQVALGCATVVR